MRTKFIFVALAGLLLGCNTNAQQGSTRKKDMLLVLNKADNTMVIVDPLTLKITATVATGVGPHELAVSADGKLAYVGNYGVQSPGNSLSVIDLVKQKEIRRVDLGAQLRPHDIREKNGKVYFTSELTRTVGRYDFTAGKVDWITGTGQDGGHMVVLTPGGNRMYVANRVSNTVSSIPLDEASPPGPVIQIKAGSKPEAIDISPGGREVWVGNAGDGTITIIEVASNSVNQTIQVGKTPIRLKFTTDGKRVLVSDNGSGELIVIDVNSRNILKRVKADGGPAGIVVAPDGSRAFVARSASGIVSVFDLGTLEFTGDIKTGNGPDGIAWVQGEK
ncbi:MAG TPA: YncE family protein [Agriterribacter sp.]|nr:YncE family protein [Agriterribacter sp.]